MNGNFIVIKHSNAIDPENLSATTTLYSCHLHLSEMSVKTLDIVKEGDLI
jgi:murein DD-endopeptidase MepM/ murein hydrolase activator NlpD